MQQLTEHSAHSGAFPASQAPRIISGDTASLRLDQLKLETLIQQSQIETQHFFHNQPYDPCFTHEIFRRAVVERNEDAWTYLYASYCALVHSWVQRSTAFAHSGESSEVLVNMVFARFWQAVSAKNFAEFPTQPSLLAYLRHCAETIVIDHARGYHKTEALSDNLANSGVSSLRPLEDETIDRMRGQELWKVINQQLRSEAEHTLVYCSFIMGMPAHAILQQRPELFDSITTVYTLKRTILERLSRCPAVRQLLG